MYFRRKIYETRSQKAGHFSLGFGLLIVMNVTFAFVSNFVPAILSLSPRGSNNLSSETLWSLILFFFYTLPFVIQILLMVYFGLTRYWIALGMLAAFAVILLLVFLVAAVFFVIVYSYNGTYGR